jgi:hypothetical protein
MERLRITTASDSGNDIESLILGLFDAPLRANFPFFWNFLSAFLVKSSRGKRRKSAIGALKNLERRAMLIIGDRARLRQAGEEPVTRGAVKRPIGRVNSTSASARDHLFAGSTRTPFPSRR